MSVIALRSIIAAKSASSAAATASDTRSAYERMRREAVVTSLEALLARSGSEAIAFRLVRSNGLSVVATINNGAPRTLVGPYADNRLDDFAGIVRAAVSGWKHTLGRRAGLSIVR